MLSTSWLSLVPPILAIALCLITRRVLLSLFLGIWTGATLLADFDPLRGLVRGVDACLGVLADPGSAQIIVMVALFGALIAYAQRSGGVEGLLALFARFGVSETRRRAQLSVVVTGALIFFDGMLSCLLGGAIYRPLFDRLKISREKLAYIVDSTSAPICMLIPVNAWGAYMIGLLRQNGVEDATRVFATSVPFNFYSLLAVALVLVVIFSGKDWGPMRRAEARAQAGQLSEAATDDGAGELRGLAAIRYEGNKPARALNALLPIFVLVIGTPVGLYITGDGDLLAGSGTLTAFWCTLAAIFVAALAYRAQGIMRSSELSEYLFKGIGHFLPIATLMLFAFAIGGLFRELGTGAFMAELARTWLSPSLVAPMLFVFAAFTAFSTGTSWGTFATLIPIAVPVAEANGLALPLAIGAVTSGGIFGDHCSPMSDTSVLSSMSASCDHMDHVQTQLPYALAAAAAATLLFTIAGQF